MLEAILARRVKIHYGCFLQSVVLLVQKSMHSTLKLAECILNSG